MSQHTQFSPTSSIELSKQLVLALLELWLYVKIRYSTILTKTERIKLVGRITSNMLSIKHTTKIYLVFHRKLLPLYSNQFPFSMNKCIECLKLVFLYFHEWSQQRAMTQPYDFDLVSILLCIDLTVWTKRWFNDLGNTLQVFQAFT